MKDLIGRSLVCFSWEGTRIQVPECCTIGMFPNGTVIQAHDFSRPAVHASVHLVCYHISLHLGLWTVEILCDQRELCSSLCTVWFSLHWWLSDFTTLNVPQYWFLSFRFHSPFTSSFVQVPARSVGWQRWGPEAPSHFTHVSLKQGGVGLGAYGGRKREGGHPPSQILPQFVLQTIQMTDNLLYT